MPHSSRGILAALPVGPVVILAALLSLPVQGHEIVPSTTAWKDGQFHIDVHGVVSRSNIILERPNLQLLEAMSLGNGGLGLGVWSQDGYTAQLNRENTGLKRLSPGQVVIPRLKKLADATDYKARLDLYNGEFVEQGG